jgi:hypothetical protein
MPEEPPMRAGVRMSRGQISSKIINRKKWAQAESRSFRVGASARENRKQARSLGSKTPKSARIGTRDCGAPGPQVVPGRLVQTFLDSGVPSLLPELRIDAVVYFALRIPGDLFTESGRSFGERVDEFVQVEICLVGTEVWRAPLRMPRSVAFLAIPL